jgi:serine/threonine protein phosphatase PrpC
MPFQYVEVKSTDRQFMDEAGMVSYHYQPPAKPVVGNLTMGDGTTVHPRQKRKARSARNAVAMRAAASAKVKHVAPSPLTSVQRAILALVAILAIGLTSSIVFAAEPPEPALPPVPSPAPVQSESPPIAKAKDSATAVTGNTLADKSATVSGEPVLKVAIEPPLADQNGRIAQTAIAPLKPTVTKSRSPRDGPARPATPAATGLPSEPATTLGSGQVGTQIHPILPSATKASAEREATTKVPAPVEKQGNLTVSDGVAGFNAVIIAAVILVCVCMTAWLASRHKSTTGTRRIAAASPNPPSPASDLQDAFEVQREEKASVQISSAHTAWQGGCATDTGPVREHNEDAVTVFDANGVRFAIVADGVGGEPYGAIAARTAVISVRNYLARETSPLSEVLVQKAFRTGAMAVARAAMDRRVSTGLRCTLLIAGSDGHRAIYGYLGDGGVVHVRGADAGVTSLLAAHHDTRGRLTGCLGPTPMGVPTIGSLTINDGDLFVIGTDGFFDRLDSLGDTAKWLAKSIEAASGAIDRGLNDAVRQFTSAKDAQGRHVADDNVTVACIGTGAVPAFLSRV